MPCASVSCALPQFADAGEGNVFAIDSVIALLMTCSRSVYSWDVVVNRVGNNLFLDKRERSSLGRPPDMAHRRACAPPRLPSLSCLAGVSCFGAAPLTRPA